MLPIFTQNSLMEAMSPDRVISVPQQYKPLMSE